MARVWWQVKLYEALYNMSYLSALEARLLRLSAIQIRYFTLPYFITSTVHFNMKSRWNQAIVVLTLIACDS